MRAGWLWAALLLWAAPAIAQTQADEPLSEREVAERMLRELFEPAVAYTEVPADVLRPRRLLIDVRSLHSDGAHDFDRLIALAGQRAIDMLVFTEHDRYTIRFGIEPLPRLLGYSQQHPSLYTTGLEAFFADLARVRRLHPQMGLYGGTESTPGYWWSGMPFRDLTLHDAERHLITIGIETPQQVMALPSFDLRHVHGHLSLSLAFCAGIALLLLVVLMRTRRRGVVLLLIVPLVAMVAAWLMRDGMDKDADFIDKAHRQGLFVIWAHPGTHSGVREGPMGVQLDTPSYSRRVFEEPTADAFAGVYGDSDDNTEPGGLWDRYMADYLRGYRPRPIWSVAAGDYHEEGQSGIHLGDFPMDIWAADDGLASLLRALREGRHDGWQLPKERNIGMEALYLEDGEGRRFLPGAGLTASGGTVRLCAAVKEYLPVEGRSYPPLQAEWVVDGRVAARPLLPFDGARLSVTTLQLTPGPHVIRLRVPSQRSIRMEANPFLVRAGD